MQTRAVTPICPVKNSPGAVTAHKHTLNMNSSSDSFNTDLTSEGGKSI